MQKKELIGKKQGMMLCRELGSCLDKQYKQADKGEIPRNKLLSLLHKLF
jgi:hypothetical protein